MQLTIKMLDEYNEPCAANVEINGTGGRIFRGYADGFLSLSLEQGIYTVSVRRGKLYIPAVRTVELDGCDKECAIVLERLYDPKKDGWYAFDAHSHISRRLLGKDAVMDIEKMSIRARGEDWNVYFAGTPYDGENHEHVYRGCPLTVTSYREYYRETLDRCARRDYIVDPGGEFIKYRYGHYVLANFSERPPVDEFRDPLYSSYEQWRHVPKVTPPPFENTPPSRAVREYRDENSFAFFAHPTSWWTLERSGGFVTNIASTIAYDALTGMFDAMVVQGYGADRPEYRELWYALLNRGYRLTGIAETDHCADDMDHMTGKRTVEPYRTYAKCGKLDLDMLSKAVRDGDCFATSGPILDYTVNGARPGGILPFDPDITYELSITVHSCCEGEVTDVEVIVNGGTTAHVKPDDKGNVSACINVPREGFILCIARDDAGNVAVGNPVYVRNSRFLNDGFRAHVVLDVRKNGHGANGTYTTDEQQDPVTFDGRIVCDINPMARIRVRVGDDEQVYDPFFDEELQRHFRYSYSGEFLTDHRECAKGDVPPEAFRIDEIIARLGSLCGCLDFGYDASPEKRERFVSTEVSVPETEDNTFREATGTVIIPPKDTFMGCVPRLVWHGHEDACDCMRRAFEIAYDKLQRPSAESGFPAILLYTEFADSVFMWGNCFNTMYGTYARGCVDLMGLLDNFYAKQHADGYICRQLAVDSGKDRFEKHDPSSTGPDIFSLAEWLAYTETGDRDRLKEVYPVLLAFHRWLRKNRTWQNGTYYSSGWGSGMDNIPRSREKDINICFDHGHTGFIDVTAQQILDAKLLIRIAGEIGETNGVDELRAEAERLSAFVNAQMWNEADECYEDLDADGKCTGVMHIGAYWTLLAGIVPDERLRSFIRHLFDPEEMCGAAGTRSLSKKDSAFCKDGGNYWQGGVWCITELMTVMGLEQCGLEREALQLAEKHVCAVAEVYSRTGTIWESYDPCTVAPGRLFGNLVRSNFVGFSGVGPITMAIRHVLGVRVMKNRIVWDIRRGERHGVENLFVDGQYVSLIYDGGRVECMCEKAAQMTINGREYTVPGGNSVLAID